MRSLIRLPLCALLAASVSSCGDSPSGNATNPDAAAVGGSTLPTDPSSGGACPTGEEPLEELTKCAEAGDPEAQNYLGVRYADGVSVPENDKTAVFWYRKAAEQGHAMAQHNLGLQYSMGEGVDQNFSEALEWFRKSAEQGAPHGQYELGMAFDLGRGTREDDAKAVEWYRKAADQGLDIAQKELGVMYQEGTGVSKNLIQAFKWYSLAAGQGHEEAKQLRETLKTALSPAQISEGQALATEWKPQR